MQVVRAIGGRAPLLTSVGKLFLAADETSRVRAYATRTGLSGHTQNSITDIAKLERELTIVRQQSCARDNEELEPACAVSRPASTTIRASSSRACRCRRRPIASRMRGSAS